MDDGSKLPPEVEHLHEKMKFALALASAAAVAGAALYAYINQCPRVSELRGAVIILTGASSGIGAELAVHYGRLGANLVLAARRREELEAVASAALTAGASAALSVPTDMSDPRAVTDLVNVTIERFGRIDILFLNHAIIDDALFVSHPDAASVDSRLTQIFRANVVGSAMASRLALPHLERSRGHIAVVSSASAKVAAPFHSAYVASKCALHGVFDTLRAELHLLRSNVTIGLQVLGMIGTKEVLQDPELAGMAAPVPAVAAEMICAAQARWDHTYVPKWYWTWTMLV